MPSTSNVLVAALAVGVLAAPAAQVVRPEIPKSWDEAALESLEVPLPDPAFSPRAVPADYYYRIPVRPIYRGFPIYAPGREPAGYLDSLAQRAPEPLWDDAAGIRPPLETEQDWIAAGEMVFDSAIFYDGVASVEHVRAPEWFAKVKPLLTEDGVVPFTTYVVRERGRVEVGNNACGFCHTRVLPDGRIVKGAQGNFPFDRAVAFSDSRRPLPDVRITYRLLFGAPWLKDRDPAARLDAMTLDELIGQYEAIPPGVAARHRASAESPPAIPDLIGLRDRVYLDRTGLVRQRDIADVMRYAALNNEIDFYSNFGGFNPAGKDFRNELPDPADPVLGGRYSDEQLYALAKFLYALTPPVNPNRPDARTKRGEGVFRRAGCASCHTPPLYTNNALLPVTGFTPPPDHRTRFTVMSTSIGTDPTLTLYTRRGTGYYKVPSLRGVWYRGPFEHNGSVATLEDWLDPRRLRDDYVPTGFRGAGVTTRAVKGHPFGLTLSADDKSALVAFLKTL